jgi:hypothetical protein
MSRKSLVFLLVGLVYIVLVIMGLSIVYSVGQPVKEKKVIESKTDNLIAIAHIEKFGKLERPQVVFNHKKHEDALKNEGCKACHRVKDEGIIVFDFPKEIKSKGKKALMNAYHDECIGCHKRIGYEDKKTGPVVCADCHSDKKAKIIIKYPEVKFDFVYHDKHVKKLREKTGKDDCSKCHHVYDPYEEDEASRLVYEEGTEESCYYCHDIKTKRGPDLSLITKVTIEKGLSMNKASHQQCINCHLYYTQKGDKDSGPIECVKCHTGKYRTIVELAKVEKPSRNQPEKPYINVQNAKMKGVVFNHKSHESYTETCRECHHESLKSCKECHSLTGKSEGKGVNIADAYHRIFSKHSCIGCHNKEKAKNDCNGCHHYINPIDIESMNPKKETCGICHSGTTPLPMPQPISTSGLNRDKLKEVTINVLEREYEPSKFPHLDIIEKLIKISNDSKLATFFHRNRDTICEGCHHRSYIVAEAQKDNPPNCKNCHMIAYDRKNLNKTRLLSAYHRQCLGCHDNMSLQKGRKCTECHKEKKVKPIELTTVKNDYVVKMNKTNIINVWKPE